MTYRTEVPTHALRFVPKSALQGADRTLQQAWQVREYNENHVLQKDYIEWRDVPFEPNPERDLADMAETMEDHQNG